MGSHQWRSVKPYIGLFHNYWRFHPPIDEITSKGSSCSLFATRAVSYNWYAASCRSERFLRINPLKDHHSRLSRFYLIFSLFFGFTCALFSRFIAAWANFIFDWPAAFFARWTSTRLTHDYISFLLLYGKQRELYSVTGPHDFIAIWFWLLLASYISKRVKESRSAFPIFSR